MKLRAITKEEMEIVRQWRNENLSFLKTPFLLTQEMQEEFYINTICNRLSNVRFWALECYEEFLGMGGLVNISWENRNAEISLLLKPDKRKKGFGETALYKLLEQGFNFLGLQNIYGECYLCNPSINFWYKMVDLYNGFYTILPKRKFWEGIMHDSLYFNFTRGCV